MPTPTINQEALMLTNNTKIELKNKNNKRLLKSDHKKNGIIVCEKKVGVAL
jgi:hypothetical protein